MNTTNKTLYGILAFAPLIMLIPLMAMMFSMFAEIFDNPYRYNNGDMPDMYGGIMIFAVLASIVSMIGVVMYLIHATKNPHIQENSRVMWILIIVLVGTIGMLIYFFTWIRKEEELNQRRTQETSPWK